MVILSKEMGQKRAKVYVYTYSLYLYSANLTIGDLFGQGYAPKKVKILIKEVKHVTKNK